MRPDIPKIGITTSFQNDEQQLSIFYVRAIEKAGGLPIPMPILENEHLIEKVVSELDALVITGGPAITDGLIGELPHDLADTHPIRSTFDKKILHTFLAAKKPILGICYGMQLLNAHFGGTIYADVTAQVADTENHSFTRGASEHSIFIKENTHLINVLNTTEMVVNTRHTQALATVAQGFKIAATAPDGVIEAIEHEVLPIIGVQFHPERMEAMQPFFQNFVQNAQQKRAFVG